MAKTTLNKLEKFTERAGDPDVASRFRDMVKRDIKMMKDCSECSVVDFYISEYDILAAREDPSGDGFLSELQGRTRMRLANRYAPSKVFDNTIDTYFNDVKREYILHPMAESEDMEFIPENRDVFIKNNLKLVVNCAKRYRGLGMEFEDLIQIGNYGLLTAYNKFDKDRANLKGSIIRDINRSDKDMFTHDEAAKIIRENFSYAKLLDATLAKLPEEGFAEREGFLAWVDVNIKKASFTSISFIWIRAAILAELNKYARVIYVPKSNKDPAGQPPLDIVRLDSVNPHTDDEYHDNQIASVANDEFAVEDERMETAERQDMFRGMLDTLMKDLSQQDRRIVKKRFGVGTPYPLSISEIAESEGLNNNRVKYIVSNAMKTIGDTATPNDLSLLKELLN